MNSPTSQNETYPPIREPESLPRCCKCGCVASDRYCAACMEEFTRSRARAMRQLDVDEIRLQPTDAADMERGVAFFWFTIVGGILAVAGILWCAKCS